MRENLGSLLEDSSKFFNWINGSACALIALHASIRTGLVDAIDSEPQAIEQLSKKLGVPTAQLSRLTTFLAAHEIIDLLPDGRVIENSHTEQLRDAASCVECTIVGTVAGSHLDAALKSGMTAYEVYFGKPVFAHLGENPELGGVFNDFMGFMTRRQALFIFDNHRFNPFGTVADIGRVPAGRLRLRIPAKSHPRRHCLPPSSRFGLCLDCRYGPARDCQWRNRRADFVKFQSSSPRDDRTPRRTRIGSGRNRALPRSMQSGPRLYAVSHVDLVRGSRRRRPRFDYRPDRLPPCLFSCGRSRDGSCAAGERPETGPVAAQEVD